MITVSHDFVCPMGEIEKGKAVVKEYKELFDPSPSCRVSMNASGQIYKFYIEDDYDSFADYEVKWPERTATPEFQAWLKKWFEVVVDGSFETNYRHIIE